MLTTIPTEEDAVKRFIAQHAERVLGVLSGFDRLLFRGTLVGLTHLAGFVQFLNVIGVLRKDFKDFFLRATERLKQASLARAAREGRPVVYLPSSRIDKEAEARKIAARDGVRDGLVAVLTCVEPAKSFQIYRNRETQRTEVRVDYTKCKHLYHYFMHPTFGLMHVRLQTYFPFPLQVCLNGREWLARQMDQAQIRYIRRDNCFARIDDLGAAQALADSQKTIRWDSQLNQLAAAVNPALPEILGKFRASYYWSLWQSEWATDLMFPTSAALTRIYRPLVLHGISTFGSGDVMRFLGGKVHGCFAGEITSDFKNRPEGIRVKHTVNHNSVKIYDKQGTVLRVETTINNPEGLKVFRAKHGEPRGPKAWRPMRLGIADLRRRAELSQACNERYLDALAAADTSSSLGQLLSQVTTPVECQGHRVRGLRPWSAEDIRLIRAVNRAEHQLRGFRNRDIRFHLFAHPPADSNERRRRSQRTSRLLRLLRSHALIKKLPKTHAYRVTSKGAVLFAAILAAQDITLSKLNLPA